MSKTTTKTKNKTIKTPTKQKSDFFLVLLWLSGVSAISYVMALMPKVVTETLGSVPTGWYAYWAASGTVFAVGLYLTIRRKLIGLKLLVAISVIDAILPYLIFSQQRNSDGIWDVVTNLGFAALWVLFLKRNPKFLQD